jgi:hypothetical protein
MRFRGISGGVWGDGSAGSCGVVAEAYGWPADLSEEGALAQPLTLNLGRAAAQR